MEIRLYKGDCSLGDFDQNTIWDEETMKEMEYIDTFRSYKEAFECIIQSINDEEIDVGNSFYSFKEVE